VTHTHIEKSRGAAQSRQLGTALSSRGASGRRPASAAQTAAPTLERFPVVPARLAAPPPVLRRSAGPPPRGSASTCWRRMGTSGEPARRAPPLGRGHDLSADSDGAASRAR
jgi:hypothetical protein